MLFVYPAIFHKEEDAYWVEFPDLEGCHTYGSSVNETMEAAQEALAAYLLTLLEQEKALTTPSDISAIHTLSEQGATQFCTTDLRFCRVTVTQRTGRTPIDVNAASRQKTVLGASVPLFTEGTDDGFLSLVSCDINQYKDTKAVKKTLTIPSWLNERAISMGINFSKVLQEALLSKIQA